MHRLPVESVVQLSMGGGDTEALRQLRYGQKSKRLVLIRMVFEAVAADPATMGPLPSVRSAWNLLSRVQYEDPEAFEEVLMYPSTGVWAAHVLRRLRGVRSSSVPLWTEVGYFHTLAAAAAIRAGVEFHTRVPVPDGGTLHLPSLGTVLLPLADAGDARPRTHVATVRWAGRGGGSVAVVSPRGVCVLLPEPLESAVPGWRPLPQVRAEGPQHGLCLALDDTDPYAPFVAGREPALLNEQSRQRWQALTEQAWEALVRSQPDTADGLAYTMRSLVPLAPVTEGEPYSVSSPESFGGVMMQLPVNPTSLAVGLVHEFQHVKLGALLDLVTLTREADGGLHYAPWRLDPRPVSGLLQGVYAYLGIVAFWRRYHPAASGQEALRARFAYARWRRSTLAVLDDLLTCGELTELGVWFVTNMRELLADWCEEPLPAHIETDAALAAADSLGMWRLRNGRPAASDVGALAESWIRNPRAACPGAKRSALQTDVLPRERAVRAELVKIRWEDPRRLDWLREHPDILGATFSDTALLDGDFDVALRGYRQQLMARPEASSPWIGLGLAARGHGNRAAAAALLGRPELVRAVQLRVAEEAAPADPLVLAEWIGRRHPEVTETVEAVEAAGGTGGMERAGRAEAVAVPPPHLT
ncbi:HEXXH motif domain-containing protein [Streptomyces sp. NPDC058442]|uniref:HEXXH motif domain-containing protein n=1 Tax=Streptomyces sp. NPDC058442 TaxID=3346503 RepID=UPI003667FD20